MPHYEPQIGITTAFDRAGNITEISALLPDGRKEFIIEDDVSIKLANRIDRLSLRTDLNQAGFRHALIAAAKSEGAKYRFETFR